MRTFTAPRSTFTTQAQIGVPNSSFTALHPAHTPSSTRWMFAAREVVQVVVALRPARTQDFEHVIVSTCFSTSASFSSELRVALGDVYWVSEWDLTLVEAQT